MCALVLGAVLATQVAGVAGASAQSSLTFGSSFSSSLPALSSHGSSQNSSQGSTHGSSDDASSRPGPGEEQPESPHSHVLFAEDFDGVENPTGFTHALPQGWDSTTEGVTSGEARWKGWTLSTIREWTWAVGTDMRHWFTQAHDNVAIIESNHQRLNGTDSMDARMSTPLIDVSSRTTDTLTVEFDHHYRQGKPGQRAEVVAEFDTGERRPLLELSQDVFSKHEALEVEVPAGAREMKVSFEYLDSNKDWWWAVDNVEVTEPLPELSGKPSAIVDVLSDIQGDPEDYTLALRQLNAMEEPAGALVLNGDLVDNGSQQQWDDFLAAHAEVPHVSGTELWTIGNHEMYGPEGSETYLKRFLENAGQDGPQDKPWKEVIVDGVPLISVNTEYYSDVDREGKEPFQRLSEEQLSWLDARLAYWESKGVTALVFTHPLLPQTVSMSHSAWYQNDFEDLEALSRVVSKYTNLIMFTSHSHSSLEQNNWWGRYRFDGTGAAGKAGFPVVNTGAILNAYLPDGDHDEETLPDDAATGLRVKVFADRIRVEAWDFKAHSMLKYQDFRR